MLTGTGRYSWETRSRPFFGKPGPMSHTSFTFQLLGLNPGFQRLLLNARPTYNKASLICDLIIDERASPASITEPWLGLSDGVALPDIGQAGVNQPRLQGRGRIVGNSLL